MERDTFGPPHQFVAAAELVLDWGLLKPGEVVMVIDNEGLENQGIVDVVAPDASVFWVYSMFGRRLFTRLDEYQVWRTPQ